MLHRARRHLPVIVASAISSLTLAGSTARAAEPNQVDLQTRIDHLQAQVDQLRQEQTISAVQTDAAQRSQYLQTDVVDFPTGYKKGKFILSDEGGKFTLVPALQWQLRGVVNYRQNEDEEDDGSWDSGFELRRVKFAFSGNVFSKDLTYKFTWATNRQGGAVLLEGAEIAYKATPDLALIAGQFKSPVHHEELTSSSKQLAVDRSLVNELLGGGVSDYVQGVGLHYKPKESPVEGWFAFHDGQNSDNTNFRNGNTDWGVAARGEFLLAGEKDPYGDFSAMANKDATLVLGAGADLSSLGDANRLLYTADIQWENTGGTAVYGALYGAWTNPHGDDDDANDDRNDVGALAQVAQMLSAKFEVFGRYSWVDFDEDDETGLHEITSGVNYYFQKHALKATADITYLPNGSPSESGIGYISSDDDQVVFRTQLQLLI